MIKENCYSDNCYNTKNSSDIKINSDTNNKIYNNINNNINNNTATNINSSINHSDIYGIKDARIVEQIFSTYILLQKDDYIFIVDQHAAHERIMYENLKVSFLIMRGLLSYY
jgi:DNA mismatch repair protein MutL